ncbi:hypothetical protein [Devosia sp. LjRoot3]|uniref:hypothetical protein n=1 Tax=Devosia sp. LjRoot3 TaxID=3342319 RepID=UPI003ED0F572
MNTSNHIVLAVALMGIVSVSAANAQDSGGRNFPNAEKSSVTQRLESKGYDVTDLEVWGSHYRAFLVDENGDISMKIFSKSDLAVVSN